MSYSILINSSDNYRDCWPPFFLLLKKYWPSCNAPIYLSTELIEYSPLGFDINCTRNQMGMKKKLTWSESLIASLNKIDSPLVLYFQEDYFLDHKVDERKLEYAIKYMIDNPQIKHISLSPHGSLPPYDKYEDLNFYKINQRSKYRISTQVGLWRRDTLLSYLNSVENGWMFEIFGTWRSWQRNEDFLYIVPSNEDKTYPFEYIHTGIIKGRWNRQIVDVFKKNDILLDYSQRGFYQKQSYIFHKFSLFKKLIHKPKHSAQEALAALWKFGWSAIF